MIQNIIINNQDDKEISSFSLEEAQKYLNELIGLPLSRARWSYGTLFLEFWDLVFEEMDSEKNRWRGEIYFMIEPTRRFQRWSAVLESCYNIPSPQFEEKTLDYIWSQVIDASFVKHWALYELIIKFQTELEFYTFAVCPWHDSHRTMFFRWDNRASRFNFNQRTLQQ